MMHDSAIELLKKLSVIFSEGPSDKAWEDMADRVNFFLEEVSRQKGQNGDNHHHEAPGSNAE